MKTFCTLLVALAWMLGITAACAADQLQWNDRSVCFRAATRLRGHSLLISYCSQDCTDDVELWTVRDLRLADTAASGLFELQVAARCIYRSSQSIAPSRFPRSGVVSNLVQSDDPVGFRAGLDLAYTYIHVGDGVFVCLGTALGLECTVRVPAIIVPHALMSPLHAAETSPRPYAHSGLLSR